MSVLRLALPTLLLLFFVWRSFRQRVFLLGIPFLMYIASSVFFEKVRIFWVPSRLEPADLMMIWLVVVWAVYFDLPLPAHRRGRRRGPLLGPAPAGPEEAAVLAFLVLALLTFVLTVLRFGGTGPALVEAKGYVYLFVGFLLLRGVFCDADRSDTLDFVKALVVVNTIAAVLFIMHQGLGLPVYEATEHEVVAFMGQLLTRSFYFMPQLLILALAYVFAQRRWNIFWVAVLVVTLGALWVSYTRSLLLIAAAELVVVLGVRLAKAGQAALVVRRVAALLCIVVVLAVVALAFLPVQSQFFFSRIGQTTSSGSVTGDTNLQNRENKLVEVYGWIRAESRLLGQGFAGAGQDPRAADVSWMASDLVWVPVLYRFGLLGVAVIGVVYGTAGWRAAQLSLRGEGEAEFLSLILLGLIAGLFLESFVSWTFLNPSRYPLGFWFLALLAGEAYRRRTDAQREVADV